MSNGSDSLDHASDVELAFREKAIEAIRKTERTPPDFDGKHCDECNLEIPDARLALGKFRCVGCQEVYERQTKLYRRYT